jgi:hypothetical protein
MHHQVRSTLGNQAADDITKYSWVQTFQEFIFKTAVTSGSGSQTLEERANHASRLLGLKVEPTE